MESKLGKGKGIPKLSAKGSPKMTKRQNGAGPEHQQIEGNKGLQEE